METQHHVLIREWDTEDWYEVEIDGKPFPLCSNHGIYLTDLYDILDWLNVKVTRETVQAYPDEEEEA